MLELIVSTCINLRLTCGYLHNGVIIMSPGTLLKLNAHLRPMRYLQALPLKRHLYRPGDLGASHPLQKSRVFWIVRTGS